LEEAMVRPGCCKDGAGIVEDMTTPPKTTPRVLGVLVDRKRNRTILLVEPTTLVVPSVAERRSNTAVERKKDKGTAPAFTIALGLMWILIVALAVLALNTGLTALLNLLYAI
jgi:hypothetical protein